MIKLDDFVSTLCLGELSNLYIGEEFLTNDGLSANNKAKLYSYINEGLRSLSARFNLLQKELFLDTKEQIGIYYLRPQFAMSNDESTEAYKYIMDLGDPYRGDLVKILEVYNEKGCKVPLDDPSCCYSVMTTSFDSLQFPLVEFLNSYSIIYQAYHPKVGKTGDAVEEINLAPMLQEALKYFVTARFYSFMNGEGPTAKAQENMALYEGKCGEAEMKDSANTSIVTTNTKMYARGFK